VSKHSVSQGSRKSHHEKDSLHSDKPKSILPNQQIQEEKPLSESDEVTSPHGGGKIVLFNQEDHDRNE